LKALNVVDVLAFDFLSPPPRAAIIAALEQLLALGALKTDGSLSEDGAKMAKLPLEPSYSKALLAAGAEGCCTQMLSLIAILAVDGSAFAAPAEQREAANDAKRRFSSPQGDTITLLHVLSAFDLHRNAAAARRWCASNFVNRRTLESAVQIRNQLRVASSKLGLTAGEPDVDPARATKTGGSGRPEVQQTTSGLSKQLRRCLTAAFFMQAAQRQPSGEYLALASRQPVAIHPSSVLFTRRAVCVIFNELLFTSKLYMRDLTQIETDWLTELAPQYFASR